MIEQSKQLKVLRTEQAFPKGYRDREVTVKYEYNRTTQKPQVTFELSKDRPKERALDRDFDIGL